MLAQAGQQNPTQQNFGYNHASQAKKLGAAAPGNPAVQQPAVNGGQKAEGAAQLGQRQQSVNSGVASQLNSGVPLQVGGAPINQGQLQPQNPPLQGTQPQYPQQAPYGTGPPTSVTQQGAIGQQGYSATQLQSAGQPPYGSITSQPQNIGGQPPYGSVTSQPQNTGGQPPYGSAASGYSSGYNAGAVGTNGGFVQNQATANSQVGRVQVASTPVGIPPTKDIPPTKKLELLKDIADPKLTEAQSKQILRDGGCKVALELDLDESVAKR